MHQHGVHHTMTLMTLLMGVFGLVAGLVRIVISLRRGKTAPLRWLLPLFVGTVMLIVGMFLRDGPYDGFSDLLTCIGCLVLLYSSLVQSQQRKTKQEKALQNATHDPDQFLSPT